jgi:uncharacterized protein YeeX (DUF496 family)
MSGNIGVIVNITGSLEAEKANVIYENNIGYLVSGSFLNPFKINLNQSIARIEYGKGAYNSTSKILARTALSGLSASAWKSGSGGWAGIFAGLASSVGTTSPKHFIVIYFMDGDIIQGETTEDVVEFLRKQSPSLTDEQILDVQRKQEKLQRYIEDAPRTIHEVQGRIGFLKEQADKHKAIMENGATFDERDLARDNYYLINNELAEQEALYKVLDHRIRAISIFGTYDKFQEKREEIIAEIEKYANKLTLPWRSLIVVGLFGFWAYASTIGNEAIIMTLIPFTIYPAIRILRMPSNLKRLRKSQSKLEKILIQQ